MQDHSAYTLLIFEDDPSILAMLQVFFTAQGAAVHSAVHGGDALPLVQKVRPDVIVLDVVMPYQDGLAVLRELRHHAIDTPVIFLTEKGGEEDKISGLDIGADDYMTKPFSLKELEARIRAQLRRRAQAGSKGCLPLVLGGITITPATREATLPDRGPIPLTKTEFDLLYYLAAKAQTVIPHAELLKEVMGYDPGTETKSLVMHVANIRRKLDQACPEAVTIKAVPGVGYMLLHGEAHAAS